ncbi:MAG: biotin--[acetyl-CoA-carboxylase] ligase [Alphaproteobacteria bacterium]
MRFITKDAVASTNEEVKAYAEQGDLGPLWVRAVSQTSGRGRRGRIWASDAGNLYCTGLYPDNGDARHSALLSFVAALAVYDLVTTYVEASKVSLKWPNDVLIRGAKTSGILLESGCFNDQSWIAIGIGVNLMSHPKETEFPATHVAAHMSDAALSGPEPIMTGAAAAQAILAARFDHWRSAFIAEGFAPIRDAWLERANGVPGRVSVRLPSETFEGEALSLGHNGELQVRLANGTITDVHAGDVFFGQE